MKTYEQTDKPFTVALNRIKPMTALLILQKMTVAGIISFITQHIADFAFVMDIENEADAVEIFDLLMKILRNDNPAGDWDLRLFVHNDLSQLHKFGSTILYKNSDTMAVYSNYDLLME